MTGGRRLKLSRQETAMPRSANKRRPGRFDRAVGARIRDARQRAGLSQTKLGDALGLTFQQVQKYEHGTNRVAPSRLIVIARTLERPIGYFFGE
jgi:ribosome-binding protein aMBF1 (putative translation factor)